ncbi:MAG: polysaccharide biosynthesis C-terminal domain-containing protein [Saprospiraceae bacterium]|nr:polysaccharide biosynthesis C-terminal domain-containing protein [Saprospiraceae bacterium]MBK8669956.1 polysaccharide biosynthesis C-terminal domain-containing protein [Saprospiraceae bacterium]
MIQFINNKFSEAIFVYQYNQMMRYLVSVLISIVMVRSAISQDDIGHYEIWIFIITSMSFFWSAGIKNAFLSWYPSLSGPGKDSFPVLVFGLLLTLGIVCSIVLAIFHSAIVSLFTDMTTLPFRWLGSVLLLVSVPLVLTENLLYVKNRVRELVLYTHWSQVGLLFIIVVTAILSPTLLSFLSVFICWNLIRVVYLVFLIGGGSATFPLLSDVKHFSYFALPLVLNMLLGSTMDIIDGWFVSHYFESSFFPVFRYGAREFPLSGLLFSSLSTAMIPVLMKDSLSNGDQLRKKVSYLMHILFPLSIIMILVSPYLFTWVYNESYRESATIFNIYLLILTSRVLLPQTYNFALHQHKILIWSGISEILCNIILSYWWLQLWGVYGLAMATVVAYFVQKVILIIYNKVYNNISLDQYVDIRYYLGYVIVLIFTFIYSMF